MIKIKNSDRTNGYGWRSVFGLAAVLFILLSSCGVKASVKDILGVQQSTKKEDFKRTDHSFLITESADCGQDQAGKDLVIQNPELKLPSQAIVAVLLATVIPVLFDLDQITSSPLHPLYGDSSRIRYSLPIFIQHKRLII